MFKTNFGVEEIFTQYAFCSQILLASYEQALKIHVKLFLSKHGLAYGNPGATTMHTQMLSSVAVAAFHSIVPLSLC